jgi:phosphoglycerol transferase
VQSKNLKLTGFAGLSLLCLASFAYLSISVLGQNVHVLGDEYTYSMDAQFNHPAAATYPVWLYLLIFSVVKYAGSEFYLVARLMNCAILVASVPFIFLTARKFTTPGWAFLISAAAVLGPINSFVAYFMPDVTYFTAFWVLTWFVLTQGHRRAVLYGVGIGALACAATFVKPHGMFVLIAIAAAHLGLAVFHRSRAEAHRAIVVSGWSIATFLILRFIVGYLVAGPSGLSMIGAYSQWTSGTFTQEKLAAAAWLGLVLLGAHAVAISIWAGPGVAALPFVLGRGSDPSRHLLAFYAASTISLMLAISLVFSVRIADGAPTIDAYRLHMRYYNMFMPLLFMVAAAAISGEVARASVSKTALCFVLALLALAALWSEFITLPIVMIDAPELRGLIGSGPLWFTTVASLSALCCLAMTYRARLGAAAFLAAVLPLAVVLATPSIHRDLRNRMTDMPVDQAAKFTRALVSTEANAVSVAGDTWPGLIARFTLNAIGSGDHFLAPTDPVPFEKVSPSTRWLLVLRNTPPPPGWTVVVSRLPDWYLARRQ